MSAYVRSSVVGRHDDDDARLAVAFRGQGGSGAGLGVAGAVHEAEAYSIARRPEVRPAGPILPSALRMVLSGSGLDGAAATAGRPGSAADRLSSDA